MITLDLRIDGELSLENIKLFNLTATKIGKSFTNLIDSLSKEHGKNIDWWVSSPSSRNIFASPLFHYCCCIALLQELIREKEPVSEIITDSRAFKKIVEEYIAGQGLNAKITLARLPMKQRLKEIVRLIYKLFGMPLRHLVLLIMAKSTHYLRKQLPADPLTLIDTFIYFSSTDDRHYTGILNVLTEEERKTIYFVPTFYKPKNLFLLFKKMRTDKYNFLLKEDFLKICDCLVGWKHLWAIYQKEISPCFFSGVDISSLVKEELRSLKGFSSAYIPLLNYRFAKRLKEANMKIRLIINWFENQVIDKGLNAGFNQYFSETHSIGYQGYIVTPHYLCIYPTIFEKESNVLPKEIAVIGRGLISSAKKFCPDLDISVAPAFRFQGVWDNRKYYPEVNMFTIIVALPVMLDVGDKILKILESCLKKNKLAGVRFCIKQHPDNTHEMIIKQFASPWPVQFELVGGDFNDGVEKANLLISTGSSSCMHALAKGIPVVVVIGNQTRLTHNSIPERITEDIWCLCHTEEELSKAIQFYRDRDEKKIKEHEEVGKRIRTEYFTPVNRENVVKFLGLDR